MPVARMAPSSRSLACSKTGLVKSGEKTTIKLKSSAGKVSIRNPFLVESPVAYLACPIFSKIKMDKVEFIVLPRLKKIGLNSL